MTNQYIFPLKMATEMFADTSDSSEYSTQLIPESRTLTLNSSRENLVSRIALTVLASMPRFNKTTYFH
jgi:hypothetical protein